MLLPYRNQGVVFGVLQYTWLRGRRARGVFAAMRHADRGWKRGQLRGRQSAAGNCIARDDDERMSIEAACAARKLLLPVLVFLFFCFCYCVGG